MVWDCLIVEFLWLHHMQSLANVTIATIAMGNVGKVVLPRASCCYYFITYHINSYLYVQQLLKNTQTGGQLAFFKSFILYLMTAFALTLPGEAVHSRNIIAALQN
jgi:hypothetical protein